MKTVVFVGVLLGAVCQVFTIPYCPGDQWTGWLDRDDPSGNGDYETLYEFRKQGYYICDHPVAIDVRLVDGGYWYEGNNYITQRDVKGFVCENKKQTGYYHRKCHDYKVRFCCPKEPKCSGVWTGWYDRDNPSATGDWETLSDIRKENKDHYICKDPLQIHAQLINGDNAYGHDKHLIVDKHKGLICKNEHQKHQKDRMCSDYKVRFCCPKCYWTEFFDRDDPSATGDWETLKDLREKHHICKHPKNIDARRLNGDHYSKSGQKVHVSKEIGLICKNDEQTPKGDYYGYYHKKDDAQCEDYKVRFYCCY